MKIATTVMVGGPAHGQVLRDMDIDEHNVQWVEPHNPRPPRMTPQGLEYDTGPRNVHTYKVTDWVTDSRYGTPERVRILVHPNVINVPWDINAPVGQKLYQRQLKEAVLDAMIRAFIK